MRVCMRVCVRAQCHAVTACMSEREQERERQGRCCFFHTDRRKRWTLTEKDVVVIRPHVWSSASTYGKQVWMTVWFKNMGSWDMRLNVGGDGEVLCVSLFFLHFISWELLWALDLQSEDFPLNVYSSVDCTLNKNINATF